MALRTQSALSAYAPLAFKLFVAERLVITYNLAVLRSLALARFVHFMPHRMDANASTYSGPASRLPAAPASPTTDDIRMPCERL